MKYLPLVWRYLLRKKTRTIFTLGSIFITFILYAFLMTIRSSFSMGIDIAGVDRLMMMHKVSLLNMLPISYLNQIQSTKGVKLATYNTWFGGTYQDKPTSFGVIAVDPDPFLQAYPEIKVDPEAVKAWKADMRGAMVGKATADLYHWKVGDRVPLKATIWQRKDGQDAWEFDVSAIYDAKEGFDNTGFYFHYDYLDENRAGAQGMVGWYIVKIDDPPHAADIARSLDVQFENSPAETKTSTEKAWIQGFANQIGNIGFMMGAILVAVFVTLFFLVIANTMAQSVRERASEFAVLKTLGFPNGLVLSLVIAETLFLAMLGGGLGLALSTAMISSGNMNNAMLPVFHFSTQDLVMGIILCVLLGGIAGALPAISAMRLRIVDGLEEGVMIRWLKQTFAVTALSIRTIPQRFSSSVVSIVGIAGVVIVFVAVLSIAEGFRKAMTGSSSPSRVMVMRSGADSEMTSGLTGAETDEIEQAPGILHEGNTPLASAELFVIIDLNKRSTGTPANVPIRGVEPTAMAVRGDVKIVEGRMFQFGTNEVIVGAGANREFAGVDVGQEFRTGQFSIKVVGKFTAKGSVAETEIWTDARLLQSAYRRGNSYQSVLVRLDSPTSFDMLKGWLTTQPTLKVQVQRESDYYEAQSKTMTALIQTIGYVVAILMGVGAIFGAILTMYTAVSSRTREIATLRALGFNTGSVLVSVLGESFALAALGGLAGGLLAYGVFNGYTASTMNFSTFSQVAFAFAVTPSLLIQGLSFALIMGLFGGIFPAIRAARLPIPAALREL